MRIRSLVGALASALFVALAPPAVAQSASGSLSSCTLTAGVLACRLTFDGVQSQLAPSGTRVSISVLASTPTTAPVPAPTVAPVTAPVSAPVTAPVTAPTVAPPPTSSGVAPALLEDFSTYTSTAQLLANPRGIWATVEAMNTSRITLDTVSYAGSKRSMRYDWPNNGAKCLDYPIKPGLLLIPGKLTHVWVEFVVRFSRNFAVNAGASGCASEYKLGSLGDYSHGVGRWNVPEMQAGQFNVGGPWTTGDLVIDPKVAPSTLWDGQPHVFRIEAQLGNGAPTGVFKFWVDGALHVSRSGFQTDPSHQVIDIFGPGLNINQGPAVTGMQMWWHRIAIYATNPGWN